jgi:hypothetical protein
MRLSTPKKPLIGPRMRPINPGLTAPRRADTPFTDSAF